MSDKTPAKPDLEKELAELKKREAWFQSLINNFNEAVYTTDHQGRIEFTSEAVGGLAGYRPDELIGRPYSDFFPPEHLAGFKRHFEKVMSGEAQSGEFQIVGAQGDLSWVHISSRPRYKDGQICGVQGIVGDITRRKQAQDALAKSEERHRAFVERLPLGVYRTSPDPESGMLMANQALADMLGYKSIDQLLQAKTTDIYANPKDRSFLSGVLVLQSRIVGQEVLFKGRGGRKVWGAVTARVVRDQTGEAEYVEGTVEDITARKKAEELLRASEERCHTIFEAARDAIFTKNRDLKYIQVNRAMADLLHKKTHEVIGCDDVDLFGAEEGRRAREVDQRVLAGEVVEEDRTKDLPDGTATFHVIKAPLRDSRGRIVGLAGIARDITERKAADLAVAASEERFRQLADNVNQVFWMTSPDLLKVHYVNPAFEKTWGISRQAVYDDASVWFNTIHPQDQAALIRDLEKMAAGNFDNPKVMEFRFTRADGSKRWAASRTVAVRDDEGKIYRVAGVTEDITERKRIDHDIRTLVESTVGATGQEFFDHLVGTVCDWLGCTVAMICQVVGDHTAKCLAIQVDGKIIHGHSYPLDGAPCRELLKGEAVFYPEGVAELFPRAVQLSQWGVSSYIGIPLKDTGGNVIGILCAMWRKKLELPPRSEDVLGIMAARAAAEIGRKNSEEKLRVSEEKFAKAFRASPAMISIATVDEGRFLEVNDAFVELSGYSREEVIGHTSLELGLWRDAAHKRQMVDVFQKHNSVRGFESTPIFADGRRHDVIISADAIEYDGRECWIVIATDISEFKEAQRALEKSQATLRSVYQAAPVGIGFVSGQDRQVLWANDLLAKMTGYDPQELIGMPARKLYESDEEYERVGREKHAEVRTLGVGSIETRWKRKDGSAFDLLLSSSNIDPDDFNAGLAFTAMDLSEQREAQQEKERLAVQLRHAQKMEAIGTLAGGIAHDFNNILGVVMGYCELALHQTGEGQSCATELKAVLKAADRGKELVKEILTFSRKGDRKLRPLDLNHEVTKAAGLLERTIPKMVQIKLELADDLAPIWSNTTQMEQVIMNLGTNARDAMPEGGLLTIKTEYVVLDAEFCRRHLEIEPGGYALLKVTDTGQGMDPDVLGKIFDPFFTTKGVGRGTGLGLSIIYGIVAGHKGHVSCYSEKGQGAVFNIFLPVAREPGADRGPDELPQKYTLGGDETILLVDDEDALRQVGKEILSRNGYRVITAASGEEALEIHRLHGGEIDLVILDLGMPGMGGERCLGRLLEHDSMVKVVIASGYPLNDRLQGFLAAGVVGYVPKPFRSKEILAQVRAVIDRKQR